jgi:hypothetical protein
VSALSISSFSFNPKFTGAMPAIGLHRTRLVTTTQDKKYYLAYLHVFG